MRAGGLVWRKAGGVATGPAIGPDEIGDAGCVSVDLTGEGFARRTRGFKVGQRCQRRWHIGALNIAAGCPDDGASLFGLLGGADAVAVIGGVLLRDTRRGGGGKGNGGEENAHGLDRPPVRHPPMTLRPIDTCTAGTDQPPGTGACRAGRKKRRVKTLLRRVQAVIALKGIGLAQLVGLVLVIVLVFGGLVLTGGRAAMHALPFELALIGGAAVGTVLIGNSLSVSREALGGFAKAFRGAKWGRDDYQDLLVLLGTLMRKARQGGFVAIESDIEDPETSAVFQAAPRILDDDAASGMVCDAFRLMALDLSDPARAEARMDQSIAVYLDQRMKAVGALHTLADALPALGIVAAVLGIIRTMGSINQSPAILGAMIGSALLGTFLGVFLAYGLVGPVAARFGQIVEEDARFLDVIRSVLGAYAEGLQPGIALEMGRTTIPPALQPDPSTLERALSASRFVAKSRTAA